MKAIQTECLIIGSGIAGLSTALKLAENKISCTVLSASNVFTEANTRYAQGGIIYKANLQDSESLFNDIMEAGGGVNYPPAVRLLVEKGPEYVEKILLEKCHVEFDKDAQKNPLLTREGGHSHNRILFRGDESGKSIQEALLQTCQKSSYIQFISSTTAVNLLMSAFHNKNRGLRHEKSFCFGAFVFDQNTQEVYPLLAKQTVLATGGIGQLYLYNTNSRFARGDGIALAHRAGCRIENLEFIQFHPTAFFHPNAPRFLISEALRGEGAVLINSTGERFCKELESRDKVAKAIHQEMLRSGQPNVFLDICHKDAEWIKDRFPFVYKNCLAFNIDITKEPIPVVPAAHYHCGGVWSSLAGETSIPNLFAIGETSCTGLHGANRLASTSLLEGLVWGTEAANQITKNLETTHKNFNYPEINLWKQESVEVDPSFLKQDWLTLKQTMWNYVGLIKTDARLKRAEGILTELYRGIDTFYRRAILSDELIGLRHAALVAILILEASKRNPNSLGCYQREELSI
jgi:L-aspartate oxidase